MLLTYSPTKAKRALCDVAQFTEDLLGCASRVHNILTTVMTRIVVDKSTDHALTIFLKCVIPQAAQTLFVIYIRDSIALRFEPFKRMYENGSKIALNSTCSSSICSIA